MQTFLPLSHACWAGREAPIRVQEVADAIRNDANTPGNVLEKLQESAAFQPYLE